MNYITSQNKNNEDTVIFYSEIAAIQEKQDDGEFSCTVTLKSGVQIQVEENAEAILNAIAAHEGVELNGTLITE